MNKRLLIVTGPQGSGNHLWSKVFSETPSVQGWKQLTEEYWVGHGNEPFADVWEDPTLFPKIDWPHDMYFTSISCPYMYREGPVMPKDKPITTPKYQQFIEAAEAEGFDITMAVIGRDHNILSFQQQRVRTQVTWPIFLDDYDATLEKYDPLFISTELLYLYGNRYLKQISKLLDWPIEIDDAKLNDILKDNTNLKYLRPIEEYWLDKHMLATNVKNGDPANPNRYKPRES
jgi:hypothetical protein